MAASARVVRDVRTTIPPFQDLLDAHRTVVYRFCRAAVGPIEADDVFQETFLAALRAYPRLRDGEHLDRWLLRIASRKAIDHHRARGRRRRAGSLTTTCGRPSRRCRRGSAWRSCTGMCSTGRTPRSRS